MHVVVPASSTVRTYLTLAVWVPTFSYLVRPWWLDGQPVSPLRRVYMDGGWYDIIRVVVFVFSFSMSGIYVVWPPQSFTKLVCTRYTLRTTTAVLIVAVPYGIYLIRMKNRHAHRMHSRVDVDEVGTWLGLRLHLWYEYVVTNNGFDVKITHIRTYVL